MKLVLSINMDNAAFKDCAGTEAARILRAVATRIEGVPLERASQAARWANGGSYSLMDINGNKIGKVKVVE